MSWLPPHPEIELRPDARRRLDEAHREVRCAVAGYLQLTDVGLRSGEDAASHPMHEIAGAQQAVERAERDLWTLREELLGWRRSPSVPRATFVADWFCEEDAVYDEADPSVMR